MIIKFKKSRNILECSFRICVISLASVLMVMGISHARGEINETNIYQLRLMIQTFDGAKEFSHSQTAGIARMRKGNESYVLMDFHDGAVVIERPDRTSLGNFKNTTGAEAEFKYDYETNTLSGSNSAAKYFNEFVRPFLKGKPKPGVDVKWTQEMSLAQLGATVSSSNRLSIKLERKYFSHGGMDYALIRYQVPAFSYDLNNETSVVHWGQGVALMDPGFGTIYWNATLFRAVAKKSGEAAYRPYRYMKTLAAVDDHGRPLIDPRKIDGVAEYFNDFYALEKTNVLPFSDNNSSVNQMPIILSANLDVMALSLGENSPNLPPQLSGQYVSGNNGVNVSSNASINFNAAVTSVGETGGALDPLVGPADKAMSIIGGLVGTTKAKSMVDAAKGNEATVILEIASKQLSKQEGLVKITQKLLAEYSAMEDMVKYAVKSGNSSPEVQATIKKMQQMTVTITDNAKEIEVISNQRKTLGEAFKYISDSKIGKTMKTLKDSKLLKGAGEAVGWIDNLNNIYSIYEAQQNILQDTSPDAQLKLSGEYSVLGLGITLAALIGDGVTLDYVGASTDAYALLSGYGADTIVLWKANKEMGLLLEEKKLETRLLEKRLFEMKRRNITQGMKELENELNATKNELVDLSVSLQALGKPDPFTIYHPNWDPEKGEWKNGTRQWNEEEAARKKIQNKTSNNNQPTKQDWEEFNRKISEIRDPYPKGPKYVPKDKQPESVQQYSDIPDWLTKMWEELPAQIRKEKLDSYQAEILKQRKEASELREAARRDRIKNGGLWDEPVVFEPVVWDPPVWEPPVWTPPEWVPPEFDAPVGSIIDFTEFSGSDDPNWLGFASVMAYQYGDLSGTVETDLSKWSEWLATQDVRKLTRLALQAGYPNLASALVDWKNLTRNAADDGWRKWAMAPPSCSGFIGCGPQYLGRWTMKKSQLALGDILADSREIFSTAGLSDISIGGFLLSYLLRDFGLEDGDIVDVVIKQFGRVISKTQLSLLNDGTSFNIALRPGVASVEITAVNEGAFSPNTAQIRIDNVKDGDAVQSYSLLTGEVAVLRVEPGK